MIRHGNQYIFRRPERPSRTFHKEKVSSPSASKTSIATCLSPVLVARKEDLLPSNEESWLHRPGQWCHKAIRCTVQTGHYLQLFLQRLCYPRVLLEFVASEWWNGYPNLVPLYRLNLLKTRSMCVCVSAPLHTERERTKKRKEKERKWPVRCENNQKP